MQGAMDARAAADLAALPPPVAAAVELIWDYMQLNHAPAPAAAILALGSNDARVAERAADLYLAGLAPLLIFSGGVGALTAGLFAGRSEAAAFADVAAAAGVPRAAMLLEHASTNTGENARYSYAALATAGAPPPARVLLVQKPYMEMRTLATFMRQWPAAPPPTFAVTSPRIALEEYADAGRPGLALRDILSVVVGDAQRVAVYPSKGFQAYFRVPPDAWAAIKTLLRAGFTSHAVKRAGAPQGSCEPADYEGLEQEESPPPPAPES
jgi:uncharacterized SAM-binding protein YcdF (DUF218 family)